MLKFLIYIATVLQLALLVAADARLAPRQINTKTIPNNYIVTMKSFCTEKILNDHVSQIISYHSKRSLSERQATRGLKHKFQFPGSKFIGYSIECDSATLDTILKSPLVAAVEREGTASISASQRPSEWGLARISHRNYSATDPPVYFYQATWAGAGVTVYVLDSGVRITHQEFEGRASNGANFSNSTTIDDNLGHGTHVAGTIAGKIYGVAKRAKIVSVKVLGDSGTGAWSDIIKALEWVGTNSTSKPKGRSVVNMSLSGGFSEAMNNAVQAVYQQGITVIVSAGNKNDTADNYSPASAVNALTVAASNQDNQRASFSNYGRFIDLFAPGTNVKSAGIASDSAVAIKQGTSMSCPHVTGLAAYYISSRTAVTSGYQLRMWFRETGLRGQLGNVGVNTTDLLAYNGYA